MHIPSPPGDAPPLVIITQDSLMALQNNSYISANGDDNGIGVGNKLNFYPAVDEDYETRRAEQQAESLIPLKEDLAEWIQRLLDIPITTETFLQALDNGAALCRLAFLIQSKAEEASLEGKCSETIPRLRFRCRENAKSRTWYARDNTANFLRWCRDFGINEGCMFESEDLVCHRQEKPVVVCLLELARLGYRFGLEPPSIVKIEKEIEREESELASQRNDDDSNEGIDEAIEVGDEDEAEGGDSEAEKTKEGEEEEDGEEKEIGDGVEGKEEEHIEDSEEKKLVDGMNGNGKEEESTGDAVSEGHKSRATSHATSQVSGQNDNEEENAERDKAEGEDGKEGEKGEEEENGEDKGEGEEGEENEKDEEGEEKEVEGVNGTVNGTEGDENGNEEENKDSSSETKGGNSRPNSPAKNDGGTTSPSRKSPTNQRSRIDNIKARQLDKKVKHIASEHNVSEHVSQISEGKYCIFGRVVFIRLLKEKHLMVRVGGGWDTLDHYLSHHSPTKILEFKRNDQTKTPATSPRSDPDTGETPVGTNNTGDEKYLVISGKYKRN